MYKHFPVATAQSLSILSADPETRKRDSADHGGIGGAEADNSSIVQFREFRIEPREEKVVLVLGINRKK